jgi:hypothetical protein
VRISFLVKKALDMRGGGGAILVWGSSPTSFPAGAGRKEQP